MKRALGIGIALLVGIVAGPLVGARLLGLGQHPERVPPPARSVPIGEGRALNVVDVGEGSPIVLVHGLPSNIGDWGETPERLAALGHRVVVYDRVGYGHSTRDDASDPETYTYASNARDLAALLDALGIPRATLVGWSYGGAVVQELAALQPERVSEIALIGAVGPASPAGGDDALSKLLDSGVGEPVLQWVSVVEPVGRAFTEENLNAAFARARDVPPDWNDRTRAMLALPGTLEAFVAEAKRGTPGSLAPERIRAPALVLHGSEDFLVPLAVGQDLAGRLPAAQLLVVPGGSHMLPATHPDLVAGALHALVTQHASDTVSPEADSRREP